MTVLKKFEGILFCTDLDGTLYNDDKSVSKENLDAIEYFKSEGGLFTFITGRAFITSKEIYEKIKPNAPFGCFNGAGIYDGKRDALIWNLFLDSNANELVREVDRKIPEIGFQYNTDKAVYFCKDNSAMEYFRSVTGLANNYCHFEDIKNGIIKIVFADKSEEKLEELIKLLNSHKKADRFQFIRSEKYLYEILPKGVSKGAALIKMAELLGIDIKNTIAVGDYNNDVSMIKAAGVGFAVENAVDEAKEAADYITVSNNSHAIHAIIEGLDKGVFIG